ncbi:MAG: DsrE/DsrF/DrsH-like family protein [Candidatus Binatia bacterium]
MANQNNGITEVSIEGMNLEQRIEELVERKVAARFSQLQAEVAQALSQIKPSMSPQSSNRATLFVFSNDLDRLQAAFMIANGAAAMGQEVSMFFTLWGLSGLKKHSSLSGKNPLQKMMAMMLPNSPAKASLSKMNMLGIGSLLMKKMMRDHHVESVPSLIALARELGVRLIACQMAMGVMGITKDELIDGIDYGGVTTYLADAVDSRLTLFI